ncbi:MAG: TolC family protein, partial [Thermoanaerobaculia bacterium]
MNTSRAALILLALGLAIPGFAQDAPQQAALTLKQAADEALTSNPALAGAAARTSMAKARLLEARSMWLPLVDASQSVMRSDYPVFVFGSLLEQGRFGPQHFDPSFLNDPDPLTNYRLALNVRYPLFDQFRRWNVNKQARRAVEQADAGTEEARQRILLETISRYYGVVLASEKRSVAEEAVRTAEADAGAMRDRFEQGILVEAELLAAEVQLASFRQRMIEAEGDLAIARAALATLVQRNAADVASGTSLPQRAFPP